MGVERLDASSFGFDSRCFVCDTENDRGLQVPFFHDTDNDVVFAEFELPPAFSGAPTLVHGGATLALIDEGMSWATIAIAERFAFTKETSARFDWPIRLERAYRLEVRIAEADATRIYTAAVVLDAKARTCATATAVMAVLDIGQIADATGAEITDEHRKYAR